MYVASAASAGASDSIRSVPARTRGDVAHSPASRIVCSHSVRGMSLSRMRAAPTTSAYTTWRTCSSHARAAGTSGMRSSAGGTPIFTIVCTCRAVDSCGAAVSSSVASAAYTARVTPMCALNMCVCSDMTHTSTSCTSCADCHRAVSASIASTRASASGAVSIACTSVSSVGSMHPKVGVALVLGRQPAEPRGTCLGSGARGSRSSSGGHGRQGQGTRRGRCAAIE